jgi:hypothetical protein
MKPQWINKIRLLGLFIFALAACSPLTNLPTPSTFPLLSQTSSPTSTPFSKAFPITSTPIEISVTSTSTPTPQPSIHFAVIGDYGSGDNNEARVAELVKSWQPDFIVTTGDNNYPTGSANTIDENIGQFYHEYIAPYHGKYGKGAVNNLFFPTLGNHDWMSQAAQPYLDYFQLPGNERYYDFTWGVVHFFMLDSDSNEPDGVGSSSIQAQWLKEKLQSSTLPWQLVVMHHPPYTSGLRGAVEWMRWPFQDWGADAILCGHDHYYERLIENGLVYFINGAGGGSLYDFGEPTEGSQKRFNGEHGAMLVTADAKGLIFQFFSSSGKLIDQYEIKKSP